MLRVMVVEDEPPIARSIAKLVETFPGGATVACVAMNGRRALDFLEKETVDLIFSDVKMPVMDGLELSRAIHECYPYITVVIISGFQEFEYVRSALRYRVARYLLKPISEAAIHEVLEQSLRELQARRRQQERKALESALHDGVLAPLPMPEEPCGLILLCAGAMPVVTDDLLLPARQLFEQLELDAFVQQHLEPGENYVLACGRSVSEKTILLFTHDRARVTTLMQQVYAFVCAHTNLAVTMVCSAQLLRVHQINRAMRHLRKLLRSEIRMFRSHMLLPPHTGQTPDGAGAASGAKWTQALQVGDKALLQSVILQTLTELVNQQVRQSTLEFFLEKFVLHYFDGQLSAARLSELRLDMQSLLANAQTPQELARDLADLFHQRAFRGTSLRQEQAGDLCAQVAQYLRTHYQLPLSSTGLAKEFQVSATQLAKLFKKHYGMSISEYLNSFRIQTAQAIMRANREIMVKEVAMEVGYRDQYYFSKIFKKITGQWPTEYQKQQFHVL